MHSPALLLLLLLAISNSKLTQHHFDSTIGSKHDQLVDVNSLTSITNLAANNWILGSLTQDQYYAKRFLITKNHNTSLCSLDHPFVLKGTTTCAQCPLSTPIFNLETEKCVQCAAGETFNQDQQQCQNSNPADRPVATPVKTNSPPGPLADTTGFANISNLYASNWVLGAITLDQYNQKRFLITKTTNTSLCPIDKPYVLKGKTSCEQCPTEKPLFSVDIDLCVPCASGEVFNSKTNQCEDKNAPKVAATKPLLPVTSPDAQLADTTGFVNISNLEASNWILGDISEDQYHKKRFLITKNHNTSLCPIATPYVLSGTNKCQQCPPSKPIFVLSNDTCVGCQPGEKFNNKTNQCQDTNFTAPTTPPKNDTNGTIIDVSPFGNITNLDANNWILGDTTIEKYYIDRFETTSTHNTTQCNIQTPYVIAGHGGVCEQCPPDRPIYVLQNSTCIPCPQNKTWSAEKQQCIQPNITTPNNTTPNTTTPNNTTPNTTKPNNTTPNNTNPNNTTPNTTTPNTTTPNNTTPNTTKPNNTTPNNTTPNNTAPTPNNTQPNATKPNVTEPNNTIDNTTQPQPNNQTNATKVTTPTPTLNNTNTTLPTNNQTNGTKISTPTPTPNKTQPTPNNQTNNATTIPTPTPNKTEPKVEPQPTKNTTGTNTTRNDTKIGTPHPSINTTQETEIFTCTDYQECPPDQFYDYVTGQCSKCEFGQYFDGQYQACLYCPEETPLLNGEWKCVECPSGKSIDRRTNKCL